MCGIAGIVDLKNGVDTELCKRMQEALQHRGPDDAGLWTNGRDIALAHRRLAILDLSAAGHQPMSDSQERVFVTFNGEIYNFKAIRADLERLGWVFRSSSDTEVLLNAYLQWGDDCLDRLRGMFAFALYDLRTQRLLLVRDRAGEKPLYYQARPGRLVFASELKALLCDSSIARHIDVQALNHYLTLGYVPGEMCIVKGIKKLPPAHALEFDLRRSTFRVWRYWSTTPIASPLEMGVDDAERRLESLLEDATRLQLVSDVPVGILLSGGVDSSLVTAMAARASNRRIQTFTVTFPGVGRYDEASYASQVAQYFGTDHHELAAEELSPAVLNDLARIYDEPLADSSLIPTLLLSRLMRQHVTVGIGGDGGDELFGGYSIYRRALSSEKRLLRAPALVRQYLAAVAKRFPVGLRGRNFLLRHRQDLLHFFLHPATLFDPYLRSRLLSREILDCLGDDLMQPESYRMKRWLAQVDPVAQMTFLDFQTYLPDDILTKVDRASMSVGFEVRAPWLDPPVIEFAFRDVRSDLKVRDGTCKYLTKRLARRLLPPSLNVDRKQGFSIPLDVWLRDRNSGWDEAIESLLSPELGHYVDVSVVQRMLRYQRLGCSNASRLFTVAMFSLWLREWA